MSRWRWIKLGLDVRTDRKLACLSAEEFRVFINLLCYSAEREPRGVIEYDRASLVAVEVSDGDEALLVETVTRLLKLAILSEEGTFLYFTNWADRQYDKPSDHPEAVRERVARFRERQAAKKDGVTP